MLKASLAVLILLGHLTPSSANFPWTTPEPPPPPTFLCVITIDSETYSLDGGTEAKLVTEDSKKCYKYGCDLNQQETLINSVICEPGMCVDEDADDCTCIECHTGQPGQGNLCDPNPCSNGGNCSMDGDQIMCTCPPPFFGDTCQLDQCNNPDNPCQNGAMCEGDSRIEGRLYRCDCADGYSGFDCQVSRCDDHPYPCFNGGTCVMNTGASEGFTCDCPPGWSGNTCTECADKIENCAQYADEGACTDSRRHYFLDHCRKTCGFCDGVSTTCSDLNTNCAVWAGWVPSECDRNAAYMSANCPKSCGICVDGESCVDKSDNCGALADASSGSCNATVRRLCPNACGFCFNPTCVDSRPDCSSLSTCGETDDLECPHACHTCKDSNACYGEPCKNGGTCKLTSSTSTGYTCYCPPGYSGPTCLESNVCQGKACNGGGVCRSGGQNDLLSCDCTAGFAETTCALTTS